MWRMIENAQRIAALEPEREPLRGGNLGAGHPAAELPVKLVRRAVRTVVPAIDPHTGSVPKLPFAVDRNRSGGVEVELQLVRAKTDLGYEEAR